MMSRTLLEVLIVLVIVGIAWQIALMVMPLLRSFIREQFDSLDEASGADEETPIIDSQWKDPHNGSS